MFFALWLPLFLFILSCSLIFGWISTWNNMPLICVRDSEAPIPLQCIQYKHRCSLFAPQMKGVMFLWTTCMLWTLFCKFSASWIRSKRKWVEMILCINLPSQIVTCLTNDILFDLLLSQWSPRHLEIMCNVYIPLYSPSQNSCSKIIDFKMNWYDLTVSVI